MQLRWRPNRVGLKKVMVVATCIESAAEERGNGLQQQYSVSFALRSVPCVSVQAFLTGYHSFFLSGILHRSSLVLRYGSLLVPPIIFSYFSFVNKKIPPPCFSVISFFTGLNSIFIPAWSKLNLSFSTGSRGNDDCPVA